MHEGIHALSEREKETLRFLLVGHDAKSIAVQLGLSVHTVNERLRESRRKLGVSSSREAARLLADAEEPNPNFLRDKGLRVAGPAVQVRNINQRDRSAARGQSLAWFGGGMLIMSLVVAALLLSSTGHLTGASKIDSSITSPAVSPALAPAVSSARGWLAMLDGQRWGESWDGAGAFFKSHVARAQWTSMVRGVRDPLGAVSSRNVRSVTETGSIQNAPPGQYVIVQFQTSFANRPNAVETVTLARENSSWNVIGYFIR